LNKWALALILMRDYEEAGQKLVEAGKVDPLWTQSSFYGGLLKSLEGHREAAGEMFVLPGKGHARLTRHIYKGPNDIDYFINFCSQAAIYGVIERVADDLKYYVDDKGDWIAWTFLGIADIYAGREGEAIEAFSKSAELIPTGDIAELKGVIIGVLWNSHVLQAAANDIIASLSDRQTK
jgi:tetratricopeptide (TPR) repeat protein